MNACTVIEFAYPGEVSREGFGENHFLCTLLQSFDVGVDDGEMGEDEVLEVLDGGLAEFTEADDHTDGILPTLAGRLKRVEGWGERSL